MKKSDVIWYVVIEFEDKEQELWKQSFSTKESAREWADQQKFYKYFLYSYEV